MDTAAWRRYFRIAKEYGINHCRFHSWCPPKACFEAADIEGFYLQPELPFWGKMEKGDTTLIHFLTKEGLQIQEAYGNHASFVMMAIGNELSGDQEAMVDMIARFRSEDGRHLYASGSNDYLGFNALRRVTITSRPVEPPALTYSATIPGVPSLSQMRRMAVISTIPIQTRS